MKISKMYKTHLKEELANLGSLKKLENRCTGHSTGWALREIGHLMLTPCEPAIVGKDHAAVMKACIAKLDLKYFNWRSATVVAYEPYMDEDDMFKELAE